MKPQVNGGGRVAGSFLGAAIGSVFGPIGTFAGRWIGGKLGGVAGRAGGRALAQAMESANEQAEVKTKDQSATTTCKDCQPKCFKPPKNSNQKKREEFEKQLKEQEDAINNMDPGKLVENMDNYKKFGRGAEDAAGRQMMRDKYFADRTDILRRQNGGDAAAAAEQALRELNTLDAIHTPDLSAGGDGTFSSDNSGMGNRSVNRSIGSQWGKDGRLDSLRRHAEDARKSGKKIKLTICKEDGSEPDGNESGTGSPGTGEPGPGDNGPPIS